MEFSNLFDYVYGEKAKPRTTSHDIAKKLSADQKARIETLNAMRQEKIKEEFSSILVDPQLSSKFRALLRNLNNTDLETLLYKNTTDPLVATYSMPKDEDVLAAFRELNSQAKYGYFNDEQFETFNTLFKAAKLTADFVEKNNSDDNSVAYLHAYKMMVLLNITPENPSASVGSFLKLHTTEDDQKPVHDLLRHSIPTYKDFLSKIDPKDTITYLTNWRTLIKQKGHKALTLFQLSPLINKELSKDKKGFTLEHAETVASKVRYKNAEHNPELAKLCTQYHISEANFNKCLSIQPKKSDLLPDIVVHDDNYPEYFLVKLPPDDPRAYLLGDITGCCQSIGGNSEKCVIDGITRENNGFYVLLKAKTASQKIPEPFKGDAINYTEYKIVGQGYAWLSKVGNLVFDSWENLTPVKDDPVVQVLLKQFSEECFNKYPASGRICIGLGGKTPKEYEKTSPHAAYPESPKEGYLYVDSKKQAIIAINPALLEYYAVLRPLFENEFPSNITPQPTSIEQAEWLHTFLTSDKLILYKEILGEEVVRELLNSASNNPNFFSTIKQFDEENKLAIREGNFHRLIQQLSPISEETITYALAITQIDPKNISIEDIASLFKYAKTIGISVLIQQPKLFTGSILNMLISQTEHADKLVQVILTLDEHPELLTDDIFNMLLRNPFEMKYVANVILLLYETAPLLINNENIDQVVKEIKIDGAIEHNFFSSALEILPKWGLLTQENFNLLLRVNKKKIAYALGMLDATTDLIITNDIFRTLIYCHKTAVQTAEIIVALYKANPAFINEATLDLIKKNSTSLPGEIIKMMSDIASTNPNSLNPEILTLLYDQFNDQLPPNSQHVVGLFKLLAQNAPHLVTTENIKQCLDNYQDIYTILNALSTTKPNGITEKNVTLLLKMSDSDDEQTNALRLIIVKFLNKNKQLLQDPNTMSLLLDNIENSKKIYTRLKSLDPTTMTPEEFKKEVMTVVQPTSGPGKLGIFGESHQVDKPTDVKDNQPPAASSRGG